MPATRGRPAKQAEPAKRRAVGRPVARPEAAAVEAAPAPKRRRQRRSVSVDGPKAVDVHVGQRLRERRLGLGMSQSALAEKIGLTFQQVQKYERGANRLSASVLYEVASVLDVPISFFFDGLGDGPVKPVEDARAERSVLVLARAIRDLPQDQRTSLTALVSALGRSAGRKPLED
ncbi:helix-turn-helix domain-containing protein [Zavarzinia sp. CC-PAN008]|uniref:helix-turn-helix domain-containing protein n=1 Tax=Zavarzinia sp. CC-PAN008 TaxID=3243332 RepID=UPI003F745C62